MNLMSDKRRSRTPTFNWETEGLCIERASISSGAREMCACSNLRLSVGVVHLLMAMKFRVELQLYMPRCSATRPDYS